MGKRIVWVPATAPPTRSGRDRWRVAATLNGRTREWLCGDLAGRDLYFMSEAAAQSRADKLNAEGV